MEGAQVERHALEIALTPMNVDADQIFRADN